jgi:hypothetical protein
MALEDFAESEVVVAVAVTAAVASPPVRRALRKGLVYGLAGLLKLGDTVTAAARGVAQQARHLNTSDGNAGSAGQTRMSGEPAAS